MLDLETQTTYKIFWSAGNIFPVAQKIISRSATIFSGNRQIFFEAATEVSDIEKIACIMQKMFFVQATMFLSNEKIILNMGTIFPIMEKII